MNIIENGYDKKLKEVWKIEIEMLDEIDRVCKQLGLRYFLDSGTLLGAVRNKGFIPWDDDVDIVMFRKDYEILLKHAPYMISDPFFFQSPYTDIGYYRGHSQLRKNNTASILPGEEFRVKFHQGIFLDIFPLDGVPDDVSERTKLFKEKEKIWEMLYVIAYPYYNGRVDFIKKHIKRYLRMLKYGTPIMLYNRYVKLCSNYHDSEYIEKMTQRHSEKELFKLKREWYNEIDYAEFEGKLYPIPKCFDEVLKAFYGNDYMTPKNEKSVHGETILDPDKSYKEIIKQHKKEKIRK